MLSGKPDGQYARQAHQHLAAMKIAGMHAAVF